MTNSLKNNDAPLPPPRPAATFQGAENPINSGFSETELGNNQQNESRSQQVNTWKTRGVCSPDVRTLSIELRAKIEADPGLPITIQRASYRAACALQVMSDRNFELAPPRIKADCRTALSECERAWADHGAQMKG